MGSYENSYFRKRTVDVLLNTDIADNEQKQGTKPMISVISSGHLNDILWSLPRPCYVVLIGFDRTTVYCFDILIQTVTTGLELL